MPGVADTALPVPLARLESQSRQRLPEVQVSLADLRPLSDREVQMVRERLAALEDRLLHDCRSDQPYRQPQQFLERPDYLSARADQLRHDVRARTYLGAQDFRPVLVHFG